MLVELSGRAKVLELGIGTGRVAVSLKKFGIDIRGIDASVEMVKKLHDKQDGVNIPVVVGDFTEVPIEGTFGLIFVAFNTLFCLSTPELQTKCLENVSKHLLAEGKFLVEAFVPDLTLFQGGQALRVGGIFGGEVRIDASLLDSANQIIETRHISITENGIQIYPIKLRYIWPSELDAMARLAGMKLMSRWEDWSKKPFSDKSRKHISIYEKL